MRILKLCLDFVPLEHEELLSLLPHSLEDLTLHLDDFHSSRNGVTYISSIARILTGLPMLCNVGVIESFDPYCGSCELDLEIKTISKWHSKAQGISIQELRDVMDVFEKANICFGYYCSRIGVEQFWDQYDGDKTHDAPEGLIMRWW